MVEILRDNPLLLLFVVAAIGYPLGRIRLGGASLGVAAVLFTGLAIGALHPDFKLPELIYQLGLVLFVYTVGLASGPVFFASLRRKGLRQNGLALGMLGAAAALTALAHRGLGLRPAQTAGLFAGSLTNTPALASVLDYVANNAPAAGLSQALADPVVAYSVTYPVGVVGVLLTIYVVQRRWKVNYAAEAQRLASQGAQPGAMPGRLLNRTIRVTQPEAAAYSLAELNARHQWEGLVFGRLKRAGRLDLARGDTRLALGDIVSLVGGREALDRATAALGEASEERIELDRTELDYRRIFVSNPRVADHRLRDLNLPQQFGAVVTRVRRGDVEFVPHGDTVLELGDRVRVLTRREHLDAVSAFFGDSYRALSEIDILTFGLGLALGILAGIVALPLPGGVALKLGLAGGPLSVALILGAVGRTGPMVWSLPYSANLTLRQIGLIFFLAGVGTRAGHAFFSTVLQAEGLALFLAGAAITSLTTLGTLWIGYRLLHIPMGLLLGILAGLQTQPAVLGFAAEQSQDDLPNLGYATVYPVATLAKILLAQLLLVLLA